MTPRRQTPLLTAVGVGAATLIAAFAAGWGGPDSNHPSNTASPPAPVPLPTVTSTGTNATLALNRVLDGLRTNGLETEITDIRVFTGATDPAHQLGRPGAYVARAAFTDRRLAAAASGSSTFDRGATIELFTSDATARARVGRASDQLAGEHDVLSGNVLLRLSPLAPHTVQETYRSALRATTGAPARLVA